MDFLSGLLRGEKRKIHFLEGYCPFKTVSQVCCRHSFCYKIVIHKKGLTMEVQFRRTGERRYAIKISRKDLPPVEMNPAPGYDPIMPHDLLHLVVESELGLRRGIFGQVAEGGNAGTFHLVPSEGENRREAARLRRRTSKRGERLLREGRRESAQSEHATYIFLYEWLARSADPERRKRAMQMAHQAKLTRNLQSPSESQMLTEDLIGRVCARLDDLSARWANLDIGQSLTVEWPDRVARS
jgi:hypothetical protein